MVDTKCQIGSMTLMDSIVFDTAVMAVGDWMTISVDLTAVQMMMMKHDDSCLTRVHLLIMLARGPGMDGVPAAFQSNRCGSTWQNN